MGGRGRGRGRGANMSFNVEALGFGRGEALPQAAVAPPPIFPPLSTKPLPLDADLQQDYMLVIKKELSIFWHDSPSYVTPPAVRGSIERYSDRYLDQAAGGAQADRHTDLSRIPAELKLASVAVRKRRRDRTGPAPAKAARRDADVTKRLEKLEKKETEGDAEERTEEKEAGQESDEEVGETEDVELDEGTDYIQDYFDNGEDYLDPEDDALEEGPIF
ncbi:DNA-directed RNA polymerase III subunit RPC7-like [Amphibalanus amphitrite]|uniref:DNA-directed RNA polymerase III subunit RPC7-like n=1 Tax=Amphibalanus amphitrite TaxID=1232801 RepID=UPI001C8FB7F7|nr:DNA-directed RNA polymerase III subunit RPC7-like [Amphibalanus amphitrite]